MNRLRVLVVEDNEHKHLDSTLWNAGFAFYEFLPNETKEILRGNITLEQVEADYRKDRNEGSL